MMLWSECAVKCNSVDGEITWRELSEAMDGLFSTLLLAAIRWQELSGEDHLINRLCEFLLDVSDEMLLDVKPFMDAPAELQLALVDTWHRRRGTIIN
jgi:hypothetical protein